MVLRNVGMHIFLLKFTVIFLKVVNFEKDNYTQSCPFDKGEIARGSRQILMN